MRRALDRTGATIRLWYLALVSCQIGNFWSCCAARCATLTFSMQQPVGRNEEKVQQSQQKTVRQAKTTMLSKMKRSTVHTSHIHKRNCESRHIPTTESPAKFANIPLFSLAILREIVVPSVKGVWAGKRDLALCANKIMPLTTRTTLHRDMPAVYTYLRHLSIEFYSTILWAKGKKEKYLRVVELKNYRQ